MAINEKAKAQIFLDGKQAEAALQGLSKRAKELRANMKAAQEAGDNVKLKKLTRELKGVEAAQRSLKKETFSVEKVLNNLNGASMNDLQKAFRKTQADMKKMSRTDPGYTKLTANAKLLKSEMNKVNGELREQKSLLSRATDGFNNYFGIAAAGIASLAGVQMTVQKTIDAANDREDTLGQLKALTGLAGEELAYLEQQAIIASTSQTKSGVRIQKSTDDILKAYQLVGSAKPELLKNKEALASVTEEIMVMAEAAEGLDLSIAVDSTTKAMNQYGAGADQASRFTNAIAAGSQLGAVGIAEIGEAVKVFGTNAKKANEPIEGSVALIEVLGEKAGLVGPQAGTQMRNFFSILASGPAETNPEVVGLTQALDALEKKNMSSAQYTKMFGRENSNVAQILVQNRDYYNELKEAMTGTQTAYVQAIDNTKDNKAALTQAKNAAHEYAVEIGEKLAPHFVRMVSSGKIILKSISALIDVFEKHGAVVIKVGAAIATYTALQKVKWLWDKKAIVTEKAMALMRSKNVIAQRAGIALLRLQTMLNGKLTISQKKQIIATKGAMAAQKGLNSAMKANIIMAVATGVIMLVQHLVKLNKEAVKARINTQDLNKEIAQESQETNNLFEVLKKTVPGSEEFNNAKSKLNELYPDLLSHYDLESGALNEIEAAQRAVNNEIIRNVAIRSKQDDLTELAEKANKKFAKSTENILKLADNAEQKGALASMFGRISNEVKNGTKDIDEASKELANFLGVSTEMRTRYDKYGGSYQVAADSNYKKIVSNLSQIARVNNQFTSAQDEINTFYTALLGNTTDYKKILGSIDSATSLKELEDYLNSEDDKIRSAAEARKKLIEEFQIVKTDIDNAKALKELEQYLNSENQLIKEYAEKRAKELKGIDKESAAGSGSNTSGDNDPLKALDRAHQQELLELKKQMIEKNETIDWYNHQALLNEIDYLVKRRELKKSMGEDTIDEEQSIIDKQLELQQSLQKKVDDIDKMFEDLDNDDLDLGEDFSEATDEADKLIEKLEEYERLREKFKETTLADEYHQELSDLTNAYEWGLISHEKYEKRKSEITYEYAIKRVSETKKYFDAANQLLDSYAKKYEAQKNAELARVGDDSAKVDAINRKYAKREQKVAKGQALISGALSIMRIWEAKATGNIIADAIIKGVMTAAMVGVTAAQIKEINAQQFYTGGYTGSGKWDDAKGVVHSDEFVANRFGTKNKTVRPVLDLIDIAQRNGTIQQMNLPAEMVKRGMIPGDGFAAGGFVNSAKVSSSPSNADNSSLSISELKDTLSLLADAANKLADKELIVNIKRFGDAYEKYKKMENDVEM